MGYYKGFNPQEDWANIPDRFYTHALSTLRTLVELKLAILFATGCQFSVAELSKRSGLTRNHLYACLVRWERQRLIQRLSWAPSLDLRLGRCHCAGCGIQFPFLDEHHIIPLSKEGDDSPQNKVKLCPNCHRLMHCELWELTEMGRQWLGLQGSSNE